LFLSIRKLSTARVAAGACVFLTFIQAFEVGP
jgi:hypothetical protein